MRWWYRNKITDEAKQYRKFSYWGKVRDNLALIYHYIDQETNTRHRDIQRLERTHKKHVKELTQRIHRLERKLHDLAI